MKKKHKGGCLRISSSEQLPLKYRYLAAGMMPGAVLWQEIVRFAREPTGYSNKSKTRIGLLMKDREHGNTGNCLIRDALYPVKDLEFPGIREYGEQR
jgi:hypothetical protein